MRSIPTLALFVTDALLCATLLVGANSSRGASGRADEPQRAPLPASRVSQAEADAIVAFHNDARREVGVPPVAWSTEVASFAQQWADHIAATGKFEHRPYEMKKSDTDPVDPADELPKQIYGENLAIGNGAIGSGKFGVVDGAKIWYAEKKEYTPGTPIPTDFSEFKSGHYTQMVWGKSTKIGAGKAIVLTGDFKGWTVIVCNYDPSGNRGGNVPFGETQK